jgi:hypothetical protein
MTASYTSTKHTNNVRFLKVHWPVHRHLCIAQYCLSFAALPSRHAMQVSACARDSKYVDKPCYLRRKLH